MKREIARGRALGQFDSQFVRVGESTFVLRELLPDGSAIGRRFSGAKSYRIERYGVDRWRIVERLEIRPDGAAWKVVASKDDHEPEPDCRCHECSEHYRQAADDRADADAKMVAEGGGL